MTNLDTAAPPELGVVIPIYNEAASLPELVTRCLDSLDATGQTFELLLVDDASTDATPEILARLAADPRVVAHRLTSNRGQFGATQAGLAQTRGSTVVVLDGDLQDPPEFIGPLVQCLAAQAPEIELVFAVKSSRAESLPFRMAGAVFHGLQALLSATQVPFGAGSYCAMRQSVARRVASLPLPGANLAAALAALQLPAATLTYAKDARRHGSSRVGLGGLVREAALSLALTGALSRLSRGVALIAVLCAVLVGQRTLALGAWLVALLLFVGGWWLARTRRGWLP